MSHGTCESWREQGARNKGSRRITGKGIANPVATFWTGAQMLEHLGESDAAARLMAAIEKVCAAGVLTPDVGGKATTKEVTDAVIDAIHGSNV